MQDYKFEFSVVIPIYNAEKYLREAIESIIKQNLGFEKNIQMILVNDGSPDNSKEICMEYQKKYPENIIYIEQENAGVSAARNKGKKYIEGKYVNFLDADDKWENDVFLKAYKIFEQNKDIDVIGVRQKYFEASEDFHPLDYKFDEDKIINIEKHYDCIQLNLTSGFFRAEALKDKIFDERVKYAEDVKILFETILPKKKYGIISSSLHLYRKRFENTSAMQNCKNDVLYYTNTIEYVQKYICDLSRKIYGEIIPYVQYYIMYELKYRIFSKISANLSIQEKEEYIENIKSLLQVVDDEMIFKQKDMQIEKKIYCLSLKYGKDIRKEYVCDNGELKFNDILIQRIRNKKFLEITIMDIKKDNLYIEGKLRDYYPHEDYEVYVKDDKNNKYELEYFDMPYSKKYSFLDECYYKRIGFKVTIPIKNIKQFRIMITYRNEYTGRLYIEFGKFSHLSQIIENMYWSKDKYIISTQKNKIFIEEIKKDTKKTKEKRYLRELFKQKKYKIIFYRIVSSILGKINKNKEIWLISDKVEAANDNGMHLFKYLSQIKTNCKTYFVIDKKSPDYKKMKKIGKVIPYGSLKYKIYFLLASKIISSQADIWTINAFGEDEIYIRDLFKFKFVFLQHGITKDDLSNWLNKLNKNASIFVTTAKKEYDSIINGDYGYTEDQVKLLGLPRFDGLNDNKKKNIIFMPTWRNNISGIQNKQNGDRQYNPAFKNSEYFKFYNKLINDKRLLETMNKKGYKATFCVHPSLEKQVIDFEGNDLVNIENKTNYQEYFNNSALLITDYSSVAFDFAYLNKPVIYTHFDVDTFFDNHTYNKGYFEYEQDGFGPVCYDYETTVETIIDYIEKDCKIEEKYTNRINTFYKYNDKNNCKRVYEEILKL